MQSCFVQSNRANVLVGAAGICTGKGQEGVEVSVPFILQPSVPDCHVQVEVALGDKHCLHRVGRIAVFVCLGLPVCAKHMLQCVSFPG
jgi:hypothetical protein